MPVRVKFGMFYRGQDCYKTDPARLSDESSTMRTTSNYTAAEAVLQQSSIPTGYFYAYTVYASIETIEN